MIGLHLPLESTHLVLDIVNVLERGKCSGVHSLLPRKIDVLLEKAELQPAHLHDLAGIRCFAAGEKVEQRRLSGAISPDESDLLAGIHLKRDVPEDRVAAV